MKADKNLIEWLLNESDLSKYAISKATGIHITTLTNLSDGKSLIENLSFKNAAALTEYAEKIKKGREEMRTWERDTYYIDEEAFDYDLHKFSVYTDDGEFIAEIYPNSIPEMEAIIDDLDNGADVDGWEDGQGNTIKIPR
jgi:hypothetical protein